MSLHSCHGAHAYVDYQSRTDALGSESIGFQFGKFNFYTFGVCRCFHILYSICIYTSSEYLYDLFIFNKYLSFYLVFCILLFVFITL